VGDLERGGGVLEGVSSSSWGVSGLGWVISTVSSRFWLSLEECLVEGEWASGEATWERLPVLAWGESGVSGGLAWGVETEGEEALVEGLVLYSWSGGVLWRGCGQAPLGGVREGEGAVEWGVGAEVEPVEAAVVPDLVDSEDG